MSTTRPSALQGVDPALQRGLALHRGLRVHRKVMALLGTIGATQGVTVATVNPDVTVRIHRPAALVDAAPVLLWIHGGGYVMGSARQEDKVLPPAASLLRKPV